MSILAAIVGVDGVVVIGGVERIVVAWFQVPRGGDLQLGYKFPMTA